MSAGSGALARKGSPLAGWMNSSVSACNAWRLKPRREGTASTLSIETWFAPSLQYLPVRIVIRQGPDSHIDLMIARLPQQAAQ